MFFTVVIISWALLARKETSGVTVAIAYRWIRSVMKFSIVQMALTKEITVVCSNYPFDFLCLLIHGSYG